jgi:hypothetical protein
MKMSPRSEISQIPRKLWILWLQGLPEAPYVVKKCVESWVTKNPTWEIIILDDKNLDSYVQIDLAVDKQKKLLRCHYSDLIRLKLLSTHGGIWIDATAYCSTPLDEWIDNYCVSGFFAFRGDKPMTFLIMDNWFLASTPNCPIVECLYKKLIAYWQFNNFREFLHPRVIATRNCLGRHFNKSSKTTRYWLHPVTTKIIRVPPYFIFHYMFESVVRNDLACKKIWENTPCLSNAKPLAIYWIGMLSPVNKYIKRIIDEREAPVHKLSWKYDEEMYSDSSILAYLLEGRQSRPKD